MNSVTLIVAAFQLSYAISGHAASAVTPKSPELTQIQSQLNQANQTVEQIKSQRENLVAQLQSIEKEVGVTAGSLRDLDLQIGGKEQRLKNVNKEMKQQQATLKQQSKELAKQVRASFIMGKKEPLRLLLNQEDPALASRMMVYYNYLNESRLKKLTNLKSSITLLAKLEQEKQHETEALEQAIDSHKTAQADLTRTKQQRELLLAKLNQEFKEKSRLLGQLENNETESQALIDQLQKAALEREKKEALDQASQQDAPAQPDVAIVYDGDGNRILNQPITGFDTGVSKPFSALKGELPWPTKGPIVKKFGSPRSETRWDGVLISAKEGVDIHAVTKGQVIFADWLRGYGLLIIIDHGGGYMTLYAFNQSLYKKVGDHVNKGTVIAAVGRSGGREESGLYFGIRNKGKPVDPGLWCKKDKYFPV